jgi:putative aldouronate transport system permease protein
MSQRGLIAKQSIGRSKVNKTKTEKLLKEIMKNKYLYILLAPVFIHYVIFRYVPMYGIIIAFKNYNIFKGIFASPWVGLGNFQQFFSSVYILRLLRNTLAINFYDIIFGFPAPIILALLLNEVRNKYFKKTIQTITYLPHFVSTVIIVSMVVNFLSPSAGLINNILASLGFERVNYLMEAKYFWTIFTTMNIWKSVGFGSILYLAALTGINQELYEAAIVDGAGRWRQTWNITIPGIAPTIIIMFILRIGHLLDVGYESIILMYNSQTYATADVISTYVYRRGLTEADYSFATAVGLFQSIIGLILIFASNSLSKKYSETSLW